MTDWLSTARAGTRYAAGLSASTLHPSMDFETYSEAGYEWSDAENKWLKIEGAPKQDKGLAVVGAAAYAMNPTTEVTSFYFDLRDGRGPEFWRPGLPNPQRLFDHFANGGVVAGWNPRFEWWIWTHVCTPRYGWPPLNPAQLIDTMAKARAWSMPGKLMEAGNVLRIGHGKDPEGKRLLDKFAFPRNPTKADPRRRIRPEEDPVDGPRLYAYNARDNDAEADVGVRIPDLTPMEEMFFRDDWAINSRGVQIDMAGVRNCAVIVRQCLTKYAAEMQALIGLNPTQNEKIKAWLHGQGVHLDNMQEDTLDEILARDAKKPFMSPLCRRVIELRTLVGSASVKKVFALLNRVTPQGRLHDMYIWHGARTGRPTGEGVQSTNLPKAGGAVFHCGWLNHRDPSPHGGCGRWHGAHTHVCPWCGKARPPTKPLEWNPAVIEDALLVIASRSLPLVEMFFGDAMLVVAGCLRALFIASPGRRLVSSDYSAIEGVVIAGIAGEEWRLEVFRTHRMIYEMSASKMLGIPFSEFERHRRETGQHHPARQMPGKVAELGLGFGGWIPAWRNFEGPGTDEEAKASIISWREASPALVHLWGGQRVKNVDGWGWHEHLYGLEGAAVLAVMYPGTEYEVLRLDGGLAGVSYVVHKDVLYCRVPSGGLITYHKPRLEPADPGTPYRGMSLTYEGWNSNAKMGLPGWIRMTLYSSKCAENVVQKTARDIQMLGIHRCEESKTYPVVMHTYDEIVADVEIGQGSVVELEGLMNTPLPWAPWPILAKDGWEDHRYRK